LSDTTKHTREKGDEETKRGKNSNNKEKTKEIWIIAASVNL
jgi:hypothetical protein